MKRILLSLAFAVAAFAQPQPFSVWFTNPTGQACQGGQGAIYAITGGLTLASRTSSPRPL